MLSFDYKGNSALSDEYILKVQKVIDSSNANFGGKGHINLLYNLSESISAVNCIETGVAYGWSSESLLRSITKRDGKLISIDMPMIGQKVTGDREAYNYLVESIRQFPSQNELSLMFSEAGFARVKYRNLSNGIVSLHSGWKL